ncbi:hypothetical protein AB6A40_001529 [Gnathostoma spinigerum]|uniref:Uncharacterized protein n=1 Tax=Gnathostoma spinigerum TaxID=75299 RepID=A0ABD6EER2_9BILA
MGDHGMRFGSLRRTKIGTYEDDNPNMIISVPYWLRSNRQLMTNIHMNSRRHTSHYDLHATLYDIAHIARANGYAEWGDHDFRNEFGPRKGLRAKSLFRPITYDRTCKEMEIAEEYCLCIEKKEGLDSNDVLAVNAGKSIISYINTFLASKNKSNDCLVLNFTEVVKAEKSMYEPRVKVVAKASPSGGLYEAVMLIEENENIRPVPISKITRNDAYGNTGDCAFEEDLKPICFCKPGWEKRSSTQPSTTQ